MVNILASYHFREVLCHVYDELTTEEAIRVATNHNRKHAVFPITFQVLFHL